LLEGIPHDLLAGLDMQVEAVEVVEVLVEQLVEHDEVAHQAVLRRFELQDDLVDLAADLLIASDEGPDLALDRTEQAVEESGRLRQRLDVEPLDLHQEVGESLADLPA